MIEANFEIVDANTVVQIARTDFQALPLKSYTLNVGKDFAWNKTLVDSAVRNAISNGESIPKTVKSLREVSGANAVTAKRVVRTAMTNAQNLGRTAGYEQASALGIKGKVEWIATMDRRVRHSHALLDGEKIEVGGKFSNGCRYPGDPNGAGSEIYNCRCTTGFSLDGIEDDSNAYRIADNGMSYDEWKASHATTLVNGKTSATQASVLSAYERRTQDIAATNSLTFVAASTLEEAQAYAQQFIGDGYSPKFKNQASYKGISVDVANEVNEALLEAYSRTDIPKINGIKVVSPKTAEGKKAFSSVDAVAAYNPVENGIYLNKDALGTLQAHAKYEADAQEAFAFVTSNTDKLTGKNLETALRYKEAGRSLVDSSIKGKIQHELGHHIDWTVFESKGNELRKGCATYGRKLSGYAGLNGTEYMAESYVAYLRGETHLLDPEYISTLEIRESVFNSKDSFKGRTAFVNNKALLEELEKNHIELKGEEHKLWGEITLYYSRFENKKLANIQMQMSDGAYEYTFINKGRGDYVFIGKVKIE